MAMSKSDLTRNSRKIGNRITALREAVRLDPLKKNLRIHEELAKLEKCLK
jgi:hypothetical protein